MKTTTRYSKELKERAVRMVLDCESQHKTRWMATCAVAEKIGCSPESLRLWLNETLRSQNAIENNHAEKLKLLERENRELKRANEILRKAAAFFAQAELDRKPN